MNNLYPESIYFMALQRALGFASKTLKPALAKFGTAQRIFQASERELEQSGIFTKAQLEKLNARSVETALETYSFCKNSGVTVLCVSDSSYPKRLRSMPDPPCVLYVLGDLPDTDSEPSVSIVGSRKPSEYSALSSFNLSRSLASAGFVIVSGGAVGIDSTAHEGALDVGGKTVAVLGTGLFSDYLMKQEPLRRRICQSGALVTEFPPKMPVQKFSFPMRNRIIAALGLGTVVVQAARTSGSLITASFAAEQGRDIFVLPGHAGESSFEGSNELIKNGAKPVFSFSDISEEYCNLFVGKIDLSAGKLCTAKSRLPAGPAFHKPLAVSEKAVSERQKEVAPPSPSINKKFTGCSIQRGLSEDAQLVYNSFRKNISLFDELSGFCGLESRRLLSALTELEINGLVTRLSGNRFEKQSDII